MKADIIPLIAGAIVFLSSLSPLKLGLSAPIVEIVLGVGAGSAGMKPEEWMTNSVFGDSFSRIRCQSAR